MTDADIARLEQCARDRLMMTWEDSLELLSALRSARQEVALASEVIEAARAREAIPFNQRLPATRLGDALRDYDLATPEQPDG